MQMGMGYAMLRLMVIAVGQLTLAQDMPLQAFNSTISATSVSDLWANRWHQFLRFYFQTIGYAVADAVEKPLVNLLQPSPNQQKQLHSVSRTLSVFAFSGLLHEYLTLAAFGFASGSYMAFFMLHGIAVVLEGFAGKLIPAKLLARVPVWVSRAYVTAFSMAVAPFFVEPYRQAGYFRRSFHPFVVPVVGSVATRLGGCGCDG
eukprot:gene9891-10048_t